MEEMVEVAFKVPKELLEYFEEKGFAEVVERNITGKLKGKIKVMDKVKYAGEVVKGATPEELNEVASKLMNKMTKNIQGIAYLDAGLAIANMGIDVAGFAIIANKLNELDKEIKSFQDTLDKIHNVQKNEKLKECSELIGRCLIQMEKIKNNDDVTLDDRVNLLLNLNANMKEMVGNALDNSFDMGLVLKVIDTLLPTYTVLLKAYLKEHYYKNKEITIAYDHLTEIYSAVSKDSFMEKVQDYYFLEVNDLSVIDSVELVDAQEYLFKDCLVQVQDMKLILQTLEVRELVNQFEQEIDMAADELLISELMSIRASGELQKAVANGL